jgi:hypothetical protein
LAAVAALNHLRREACAFLLDETADWERELTNAIVFVAPPGSQI